MKTQGVFSPLFGSTILTPIYSTLGHIGQGISQVFHSFAMSGYGPQIKARGFHWALPHLMLAT